MRGGWRGWATIKQQSTEKKDTNADLTLCFPLSCSGKSLLKVKGGGEVPKISSKVPLRLMAEPALVNSVDVLVGMVFDVDLPVDNQL